MHTATAVRLSSALLLAVSLVASLTDVSAVEINADRMALERRYTTAHSLGDNYRFDPRDGWETVNTTNLLYKYDTRSDSDGGDYNFYDASDHNLLPRARKAHPKYKPRLPKGKTPKKGSKPSSGKSATDVLAQGLKSVMNLFKPIGNPEPVAITWYTGHDLENPSCWAKPTWTPTDKSFAAALTLDGWQSKPKCFKFLELCNSPKKCVFVRVVDSCAGCAVNSKHVDLTKAAFSNLADLDEGILKVQMREATDPLHDVWFEELWGPQEAGEK